MAVQQREGGGDVRPLPSLLAPHWPAGGGASRGGPREISPIVSREKNFANFFQETNKCPIIFLKGIVMRIT